MYYIYEIKGLNPEIIKVKDKNEAMETAKKLADEQKKPVRFYPTNPENAIIVNPKS